ncbi:integral membrane metal-binding family protein [Perilla frutescens var. frutescens]|nr:integral membrane metal-binding family protein [Perilla frutescens var. frutescens]
MAADSKNDVKESTTSTDAEIKKAKKKKGVLSRLWGAIFRLHGDDFEKRLKYISKEEAAILSRITRRSNSWRRMTRHLILFSVLLEAIAVGYAIMTTRSLDLNWKMRALRVLPMFLLPVLSSITYFTLRGFTRMFDQKDHKTLDKLRAERQAKIDELKEKTNYYTTQQLIQRYDPDPAAKAAAATVLASKLGADSGLKVYVGDDSKQNVSVGKSNDLEVARTSGLRNRKPSPSQNTSPHHTKEESPNHEGTSMSQQHQMVVEHHPQTGSSLHDGGWIARFAALLVGEDPMQSYALICGNCHMHNGLARKEDFPYITYYCPHCHALNQPKQSEGVSGSNSPSRASSVVEDADVVSNAGGSNSPTRASSVVEDADVVPNAGGSMGETISASNSPVAAVEAHSKYTTTYVDLYT